jgi:hypothetical protein
MGDIGWSLIVIAVTGLIVGGIFLFIHRKGKAAESALHEMAIQRGWSYEPFRKALAWGYHLVSPSWTLEAVSRSSGNSVEPSQNDVEHFTRLIAPGFITPGRLMVKPRQGSPRQLSEMELGLAAKAAQMFIGSATGSLEEVQEGSSDLRNRYQIIGQSGGTGSSIFTPQVESILLNWKGERPWIEISPEGMEIRIPGKHLQSIVEIRGLVDLAESIQATGIKI